MTVSVFRPVSTDLPIIGQWIRIFGIWTKRPQARERPGRDDQ
jgi:hypothetical protein